MADRPIELSGRVHQDSKPDPAWDQVITPEIAEREGIEVIRDWDNDGLPDNDPQVKAQKKRDAESALKAINDCSIQSIKRAYIHTMHLTHHNQQESLTRVAQLFNTDAASVKAVLQNKIQ